ncbi:MAG: tetratricopeptide repeat protein [Planctomycetota bacterium]
MAVPDASNRKLRVDLGCGDRKPAGFIGVDVVPGPCVDVVADLTKRFPFEDNSVAFLRAHDAIEHWPDRLHTMNEIWRICEPGATVDIVAPSTDGRGAFQDPTHVSFWNQNSFYYYSVEHPAYFDLCRKYGFQGGFKIVKLQNVQEPDNVVHVCVELTVVKEAPPPAPQTRQPAHLQDPKRVKLGELQQAVRANPLNRQPWNDLAKFCQAHGLLSEAAALAAELAAEQPRQLGLLLAAAGLARAAGNQQAARGYYERVLELDPANREARAYLKPAVAAGAPPTGIPCKPEAPPPGPALAEPAEWHERALKLAAGGQFQEARDALKDLVTKHPDYSVALNDLAVLCYQAGCKDEALMHLERAAELMPKHVNTLRNLLDMYLALKRHAEAVRVCKQLLALNPADLEAQKVLVKLQAEPAPSAPVAAPASPPAPATETPVVAQAVQPVQAAAETPAQVAAGAPVLEGGKKTDKPGSTEQPKTPPLRGASQIRPNAPCPCGSGKKYKKCCGRS